MKLILYMDFIKKYYVNIVLCACLLFVIIFSFSTLLTKPKIWSDEAMSIELARNLSHGKDLNIQTDPGVFYAYPYLVQATGYPVTVSLAGIFRLFGLGLYQARVYMLIWMIVSLVMIFVLGRRLFDEKLALLAVILTLTFASFYGSGRTVVGEIPGFTFLLIGLYFWAKRESYLWLGFFWGLAVVTKPSVFALLIPTICLVLLLESNRFIEKIKRIGTVAIGMLPAGILSIFFIISHPFSKEPWVGIFNFFRNPYSSTSIASNIAHNLYAAVGSTTLIYFGFLLAVVALARYYQKQRSLIFIYNLVLIYSLFAFIYYLRSPGWIRYILISELLIIFILPNAIQVIVSKLKKFKIVSNFREEMLLYGAVAVFILIQAVQLFTGAQLYDSSSALRTAKFINDKFPDASVASFYSLEVSVLLKTEKRFNTVDFVGMPRIGNDPLLAGESPEIIIVNLDYQHISRTIASMDKRYKSLEQIGKYVIYSRS